MPTTTIATLSAAALSTYSSTQASLGGDWAAIPSSLINLTGPTYGYAGQAWVNVSTGEVIIANRGTVPTLEDNTNSDSALTIGKNNDAQPVALEFAREAIRAAQLILSGTGLSISDIYITGHSLGGRESQNDVVALGSQSANPASGIYNGYNYKVFTFDSPGLGGTSASGIVSDYSSFNFVGQGDQIHGAGGPNLPNTTVTAVPVGPTAAQILQGLFTSLSPTGVLDAHSMALLNT